MIRIGLIGHGKAGQAVASVLQQDPRFDLRWIARRQEMPCPAEAPAPVLSLERALSPAWLRTHPVDGVIDFSARDSLRRYGPIARERGWAVVSAISAYRDDDLDCARQLGQHTRVLCSPNITLGINFMMVAAGLLRRIAPHADVEILEQHFRDKPEVSGTARKLAERLDLPEDRITSLRLGGIVGHHEVIFGFPYQTVRIAHDAIRREAFGTGAAFAMSELMHRPSGFYTFEDLLLERLRDELTGPQGHPHPAGVTSRGPRRPHEKGAHRPLFDHVATTP
ncbi:dihydrodipicolinate reductase C-terminal domain-containing protein [uncultured Aquabacterium sp.]|uniref:dihydrodipicolinate reductase C-terminal domain-containing protein n=1 Tax=Aquabacterium sp. TaxID=1872578 RepID=UPI0025EAB403|nr:dihydrodipicolinate reductase C-terminal domain-containing protein [uncultured Aquabacterium sp.]